MKFLFALAASAVASSTVLAQNLIVNGDFEAGNSGFTSGHAFRTVSDSPFHTQYGVPHTSFEWTQFWSIITGDHTTGTGRFLIVDTSLTPGVTAWQQTVNVTPGTAYSFSMWLATWTTFPAASPILEINGQTVANFNAPSSTAGWQQVGTQWQSGAASIATIRIYMGSAFQPGDDVAFDDLDFRAVPTPSAGLVLGAGLIGLSRRRR